MGLLDKIVDDIFDDGRPRRSRPAKEPGDDRMHISDILGSYFYKEDLQDLCDEAGLRTSGTKDELIDDLLNNSEYTVDDYLRALEVDQLKTLCEELDEKVTGTKSELVWRVIPHIDLNDSGEEPIPKKDVAPSTVPVSVPVPPVPSTGNVPPPVIVQMPGNRDEDLKRARNHENALDFDEAIGIYRRYGMFDDIRRCKYAQKEFQTPQTDLNIGKIDQSVHTSVSDSRSYISTTNNDNRNAVISRSQIGGAPAQPFRKCPSCERELNSPEPLRVCPNCNRQLIPG